MVQKTCNRMSRDIEGFESSVCGSPPAVSQCCDVCMCARALWSSGDSSDRAVGTVMALVNLILTFRRLMSTIVDVPHRKPPKLHFIYLFNKYRYRIF